MYIEKNLVNVGTRDDGTLSYRMYGTIQFGFGYRVPMETFEEALRAFVEDGFLIKTINLCMTHNQTGDDILELRGVREPTIAEIEQAEAERREVKIERTLQQMQQLRALIHHFPQLAKMSEAWTTAEDIDVAESLVAP